MAVLINSSSVFGGLTSGNAASAEMYGRVNKSLFAQHAGVQKLSAQLTRDQTRRVTSSSNVITGQIGGAALALTGKGATKVVVAQETGAIARNIGNVVDGFNKLSSTLQGLQQGGLQSDPALRQAQDQLTNMVRSNSEALQKAGVTFEKNGTLKIDATALEAALQADPNALITLFTDGGKGIADKLDAQLGQLPGAGSGIGKEKLVAERSVSALTGQKSALTNALNAQASKLVARYTEISPGGGANSALPGLPAGGARSLFDFMA